MRTAYFAILAAVMMCGAQANAAGRFQLEEATIDDIQGAITSGQTTCRQVVQQYIDRARAYNGTCTMLVTPDGAPVTVGAGAVRAGAPISFPTETRAASTFLPDLAQYK